MLELYTEQQIKLLLNFLSTISKDEFKTTIRILYLLMILDNIYGLFRNYSRNLIVSMNKVLDVNESVIIVEIICDFIIILNEELSFNEFKNLILNEKSSFVCFLMNLDSKISNIIPSNIEIGFKMISAASVICSIGSDLKLLTSSQNCFVNGLTIFKSLGIFMGENRHTLSNQEIIFLKGIMKNADSLKRILTFILTYAYLVNDQQKIVDLYMKNLPNDSITFMLRHGALEVKKHILFTLSNIFIGLPILESKR
jgi:hypothetical protein